MNYIEITANAHGPILVQVAAIRGLYLVPPPNGLQFHWTVVVKLEHNSEIVSGGFPTKTDAMNAYELIKKKLLVQGSLIE